MNELSTHPNVLMCGLNFLESFSRCVWDVARRSHHMRTFEPKHLFRLQVVFFWMGSFFIAQNCKFKLKILIKHNMKNVHKLCTI
jgi:hypothetical protein